MSQPMTFRDMHPIARDLVGRLFVALQQEVEQLISEDKSKMSLVERGRWTTQALCLMKSLQKEFPEADHNTEEGRRTISRLRTPEEEAADAAEIDALFGFDQPMTPPISDPPLTAVRPPESSRQPAAANVHSIKEREFPEPLPSAAERRPSGHSHSVQETTLSKGAGTPVGFPIDYDAEIAEILRRVRPTANVPPS